MTMEQRFSALLGEIQILRAEHNTIASFNTGKLIGERQNKFGVYFGYENNQLGVYLFEGYICIELSEGMFRDYGEEDPFYKPKIVKQQKYILDEDGMGFRPCHTENFIPVNPGPPQGIKTIAPYWVKELKALERKEMD